eukprot:GHRQ01026037.1.p1 GENE.GHRQ01026037.1~~GHRQ01026037.1.p1  ORF type:complete len:144 (-),score=30.91 GHRQ01026037.1:410-841(-)
MTQRVSCYMMAGPQRCALWLGYFYRDVERRLPNFDVTSFVVIGCHWLSRWYIAPQRVGPLYMCASAGENEENVRYVLDRWPQMQLVQQPLVLGGPGLIGASWLTAAEAQLVQRFDPVPGSCSSQEEDTIGFFIAKFRKTRPTE